MNCKNCNSPTPPNARFCPNCGQPLTAESNTIRQSTGVFNPDRYLPPELASKLQASRTSRDMQGERRIITMLFCDVKGSTAAAEQLDPEEWTEIINGAFEHMIRPIYKYEGTVPRLMGDAILAFFGAPIAHEDDPQRAVLAGLEIQKSIQPYVEEIHQRFGINFALRVGINTGLVVVGEVGSDLRMEYTAIGDAINLAARMEQTAAPGSVQIAEETYKLVAPFFEFEALGGIEVKGKLVPINSYRVLSVKESPGQLRGLEGLSSPLVGREEQLTVLNNRLKDLSRGTGAMVAVVGEAGLGKSTLVRELMKSGTVSQYSWLRGESLSYTHSLSYYPWRQVIRQSIQAHEDNSPAEIRRKLSYVCERCSLPGGDIPFLEAMLSVESEESSNVVMGFQGEALNQQVIEATRGFLCGLAAESPLAIVFDDLHWSDEASLNLLLNVADLCASQPILFICMSRPDRTAPAWDFLQKINKKLAHNFYSIDLAPLQTEQMDTLLNNLLGIVDLPEPIKNLIINKAEGNPFFGEEIIRSLIETNQIVHEGGHWSATDSGANVALPNTLRGVLGARIDRLPKVSKKVLQNAAVIGRVFDQRILRQLTSLNGEFDANIQYLKDASLIEATQDEYAFRHALIQEAAYESILIKQRAKLHRQIGEILEELHADRIEEFSPLLAHHFYAARDERSLEYDLMAGKNAARLYANAEAATHFSRALEVVKRVNAGSERLTSIYIQLGQVYELSGHYDRALETYKDMQAASIEREDRSMKLNALMALATIYSTLTPVHDSELGEMNLKKALVLANELGNIPAQTKLSWNLMLNFLFSDRLTEALELCEPTIALARQVGDLDQLAFTLNDAGRVYQGIGAYEKAFGAFDEANQLWTQQGNQVMLADNLGASAMANYFAGNYDKALALAEKAWEISKETDNYWGQSYSRVIPSYIYIDRGRPDLVVRFATECIEAGEKGGLVASTVLIPVELAWLHGLYGETSLGIEMAREALDTAIEKMPDWKSAALAVSIRLYLLAGNLDAAEKIANSEYLNPIMAVIRSRYLAMIGLTNIELELARKNFQTALSLSNGLLDEISPLGWINNPEILYRKADALIGLGRLDEALQALTEACSLAKKLDAKHHLWTILTSLAEVNEKIGNEKEADSNRAEAHRIVVQIAESLQEVGLRDSFLKQPRVQALL